MITGVPGWLGNRFIEILIKPGKTDGSLHRVLERTTINHIRCLVLPGVDTMFIRNLPGGVQTVTGDITQIDSLMQFFEHCREAVLFHLAGLIHPQRRIRELYDVNVEGTRNVLNMAVRHGLKKVVIVSSNSPFGCNMDNQGLFDESAPYRPYLAYGRSKLEAEYIVWKYMEEGGSAACIRPRTIVSGKSRLGIFQILFEWISENCNIYVIGDGTNPFQFVHIADLLDAIIQSAFSNTSGMYNSCCCSPSFFR